MRKISEMLRKYRLCFGLSAIMGIGIFLAIIFADEYHFGGFLRFNLLDMYVIFGIPLFGFLYGVITYTKLKKVWIPLLILLVVGSFVYWLIFAMHGMAAVILSALPSGFSLLGAGISALVCYLAKAIKEVKDEYPE